MSLEDLVLVADGCEWTSLDDLLVSDLGRPLGPEPDEVFCILAGGGAVVLSEGGLKWLLRPRVVGSVSGSSLPAEGGL